MTNQGVYPDPRGEGKAYYRMLALHLRRGYKVISVEKIDHICIAVRDLRTAMETWGRLFGKSEPDLYYRHEPEAIEVARYYVGEVGYEIMASTREGSEVDRFISKRGEGVMLISFKVPDTVAAMETLRSSGFEMIDQTPRVWNKSRYAFLNPVFMNGVLVEVIDQATEEISRSNEG